MRPRTPVVLIALLLALAALAGHSEASGPPVVYDGEFGGYVPIVDGIERPDLVAEKREGRVPENARRAEREARRALRRALRRGSTIPEELLPRVRSERDLRVSRRWKRRHAIQTTLHVKDDAGFALSGARVYRYYDPSFYAVNEDTRGARLVGRFRMLPYSYPAMSALAALERHEEHWRLDGHVPVIAGHPDMEHDDNPFAPSRVREPNPPLEFVGTTDSGGELRVLSGVFNMRDDDRFPRAIVPSALRVGFVVVADGYAPAFSEQRFEEGGVREERTIQLYRGRGHELLLSREFRVSLHLVESIDVSVARTFPEIEGPLDDLLERLDLQSARVASGDEEWASRAARSQLLIALMRRAAPRHRLPLARRLLALAPEDAGRRYRVARLLVAPESPPGDVPTISPDSSEDALREALTLLESARESDPAFLPLYPLLDALLARREADTAERLRHVRRLLAERPFDPWGRARAAELLLRAERGVEAFDHLRFTRVTMPGRDADRELARALAEHYWKLGLVEKSGFFPFIATGRVPEDPYLRPAQPGR